MKMFLVSILSLLVLKSYSISSDYYTNYENIESNKKDYNNGAIEARRSDNSNVLRGSDLLESERVLYGDNTSKGDEYDEYSVHLTLNKDKGATAKTITNKSLQDSLTNETNNIAMDVQEKKNNSSYETGAPVCLIDEYEYDYDDIISTLPHNSLRNDMTDGNEMKMTVTKNNIDNQTITSNQNNVTRHMINFYNLEPAVGRLNIKELIATGKIVNDTVWYVLEKYPCWDLPSIYAEFGQKRNIADIFVLFPSYLKNVVHEDIENVSLHKTVKIPYDNVLNKWCAKGPCYGDHTLCIFSDKIMSNICDKGYKVIVPTLLEQKALVNTINSMRNRVANGMAERYKHLPTAANMKQMIYDLDLEKMAEVWLSQCLPGPPPCSSLDGSYASQLECTKYAKYCCVTTLRRNQVPNCIPQPECYVSAIIGCIHKWFWSAGQKLTRIDIECGHSSSWTYNTVQLLWAQTYKVGCAYGKRHNNDMRVVCNFAPGAPFYIDARLYCGFIAHKDITERFYFKQKEHNFSIISLLGLNQSLKLDKDSAGNYNELIQRYDESNAVTSNLNNLNKIYNRGWLRKILGSNRNETKGIIARLVTKYIFYEEGQERCDNEDPVYIEGIPGSLCLERGRRFEALCYDFRDPTPGYRLVAIIAPVALFSLILYDLFSGVIRQTD